jgi:hypothetical protein
MKLIDLLQICHVVSYEVECKTKYNKIKINRLESDYSFYGHLQEIIFSATDPLDISLGKWQRFSDPL